MYKTYAVILDLKSTRDYSGLIAELSKSTWWHYPESAWLIKTEENPDQIWSRIQNYIDQKDFILIIEVRNNCQGWLPKEAWDWINTNVPF